MEVFTTLPASVAQRSLEMLEAAARQLARTGGMLNRDMAHDVTKAASELRHALELPDAQRSTDKQGAR